VQLSDSSCCSTLAAAVLATAAQARKAVEDDAVADMGKDEGVAQQLVELNTEGAALLEGERLLPFCADNHVLYCMVTAGYLP